MSSKTKKSESKEVSPKKDKKTKKSIKKKNKTSKLVLKLSEFEKEKFEIMGPETKSFGKGKNKIDYFSMEATYHKDDKEDAFLQIKFRNVKNIYWNKFEEDKKKLKGKDKKQGSGFTYGCSIYKTEDANTELIEFCEKELTPIYLEALENNKEELGAKIAEMNFDPKEGRVTDKWSEFFRLTKKDKRVLQVKSIVRGVKPNIQRITKKKDPKTGKKIREKVDIDDLQGKRTVCDITLRFTYIYVGNDIYPQIGVYSALLKDLEEGMEVDEAVWDEEADKANDEEVDALEAKLNNAKEKKPELEKKDAKKDSPAPGKAKKDNVKSQAEKIAQNLKKKDASSDEEEDEDEEKASEEEDESDEE